MANENKKINELVSSDDDPTAELEALTVRHAFDLSASAPDSEAKAVTSNFDPKEADDSEGVTVGDLESDLRERSETIERLQFDVEKLRTKWTGLEAEIKAREELTTTLSAQLDTTNRELEASVRELAESRALLTSHEESITKLEADIVERDSNYIDLEARAEEFRAAKLALEANDEITVARQKLKEQEGQLVAQEAALREYREQQQRTEHYADELRFQIADVKASSKTVFADRDKLRSSLRDAENQIESLRKDLGAARSAAEASRHKLEDARIEHAKTLEESQVAHADALEEAQVAHLKALDDTQKLQTQALEKARAAHETETHRLSSELDEAHSMLASESKRVEELSSERDKILESLGVAEEKIQTLTADLEQTHALAEEARKGLEKAQAAHATALDEIQAGHSTVLDDIRSEHDDVINEMQNAYDKKLDEAHSTLASESKRVEELSSERDKILESLGVAEDKIQTLTADLEQTRALAEEARKGLEKAQAAHATALDEIQAGHSTVLNDIRSEHDDVINEMRNAHDKERDAAKSAHSSALQESKSSQTEIVERMQAENAKAIADAKAAHEDEIRVLRFELSDAQTTLSENEKLSQQLVSDLASNQGSKLDLERQIEEAGHRSEQQVESLEKQLKKLQAKVDDYEEKLQSKNEAINSLLSEVAKKSQEIDSIGEMEHVIHDIGDRMSERFDDTGGGSSDRMTRQLVGHFDNQELRFPLFKDRLTIGRTRDNDIQLDAQFISRRHAVLATESSNARIIDWGSKNGVYVNSKRVTEHFLKHGDILTIGTAEFRYEERPKHDA